MEEVKKEILSLNFKTFSTSDSIPATILKQSLNIYLLYLTKSVNYTVNKGKFSAELKHSEVTPLLKKEDLLKKELYTSKSVATFIKGLWKNHIYSNKIIHRKHTLTLYFL